MTPRMDRDDPEARLDALPNRHGALQMRCCGSTTARAYPHRLLRAPWDGFMVDGLGKGAAMPEGARALAAAVPPRT